MNFFYHFVSLVPSVEVNEGDVINFPELLMLSSVKLETSQITVRRETWGKTGAISNQKFATSRGEHWMKNELIWVRLASLLTKVFCFRTMKGIFLGFYFNQTFSTRNSLHLKINHNQPSSRAWESSQFNFLQDFEQFVKLRNVWRQLFSVEVSWERRLFRLWWFAGKQDRRDTTQRCHNRVSCPAEGSRLSPFQLFRNRSISLISRRVLRTVWHWSCAMNRSGRKYFQAWRRHRTTSGCHQHQHATSYCWEQTLCEIGCSDSTGSKISRWLPRSSPTFWLLEWLRDLKSQLIIS